MREQMADLIAIGSMLLAVGIDLSLDYVSKKMMKTMEYEMKSREK